MNMINHQIHQLTFAVVIAVLVRRYYSNKSFPLADRYSTFGPRFWSGSVDSCVLWPVSFVATVLLTIDIPRPLAAFLIALQTLAWLFYTVLMHGRYGQTFGKMVTKVRVVDHRTERSISWKQAWLREGIPMALSLGLLVWEIWLVLVGQLDFKHLESGEAKLGQTFWILTSLPLLWFVAEVLTMLTNEKRRALHDFIAGTVVIRTNIERLAENG